MKVSTEIMLQAPPDKVWAVLIHFSAYPEWNRFLKSIHGEASTDAPLEVDYQLHSLPVEKRVGIVTGCMAPKYFSWVWKHAWGNWFMATEHVFRLKDKEDGRTVLFQEMYVTGLGLKFRRSKIEHLTKFSMHKLNDDLKQRVETIA